MINGIKTVAKIRTSLSEHSQITKTSQQQQKQHKSFALPQA